MKLDRENVAEIYIRGEGIEIGALHMPLRVSKAARVKYVDRMPVADLRKQYPELDDKDIVKVDILADGERLETIADSTQDFVIANHFLEHCQNPVGAVISMFRVLKPGGVLYLAVPDKRCSFDVDRPVTPLEHILRDYTEGPEWSRRQHFEEWTRLVDKVQDDAEAERRISQNIERNYSIHYHVWTQAEMLEFIVALRKMIYFEVELCLRNEAEMIFLLRRTEPDLLGGAPLKEPPPKGMDPFARELDQVVSPEPWCIDDVRYDGEIFEITGWALAPKGKHHLVTFTLNGKEFEDIAFPLPRADLTEVFWYKPGAGNSAFRCRTRVKNEKAFEHGYATLQCIDRKSGLPFREEYSWYYPDDKNAPALPESDRRRRVAGNDNESVFRLEGFTTFRKLDLALRKKLNRNLGYFQNVLDWGCGCGRVTRYFYLLPHVRLTGIDVDRDNLSWCRSHLGFGEFRLAPLRPPANLESSSFDLLIGISVFSHLKEADQIGWLRELGRVAKPGAVLLMSVLGEATVGRSRWGKSLWDEWHRSGFIAASNNVDLKGYIEEEDYYVNAYMTPDYIKRNWPRFFELIDTIPAYIGNHQDLIIMRKRS